MFGQLWDVLPPVLPAPSEAVRENENRVKVLGLKPYLAKLLIFVVGGTLAGITGALLALPLAALVNIATEQYIISARLETIRSDAENAPLRRRRGQSRPLP